MRHIVTSFWPLYFSTVSHKRCDFREKVIEHKICVFVFSNFRLKHFSFLQEFRELSKISKRLHVKYSLFLSYLSNMQRACVILYSHLWPFWVHHIFRNFLINGTIFGKKLLNIKCVFWFSLQLLYEKFLILRRIQWDIVITVITLLVKYPLFLSDFNET